MSASISYYPGRTTTANILSSNELLAFSNKIQNCMNSLMASFPVNQNEKKSRKYLTHTEMQFDY